ncbi:MAG: hypothetical protein EPN30_03810 [Actinomycetota bacterium]|nr:MAG: hypothetical protein EPN30_03810 [Actinomycetota bacterium]
MSSTLHDIREPLPDRAHQHRTRAVHPQAHASWARTDLEAMLEAELRDVLAVTFPLLFGITATGRVFQSWVSKIIFAVSSVRVMRIMSNLIVVVVFSSGLYSFGWS